MTGVYFATFGLISHFEVRTSKFPEEPAMFLIRDIMFCKPGKARPMVQKFKALSTLMAPMGFGGMRVLTDLSSERYWLVVAEMEVPSLEQYAESSKKAMQSKEFQDLMAGYHDIVESGRREIYTVE